MPFAASTSSMLTSNFTYRVVRWGLALLFIYAGVSKLTDLQGFARTISQYGIVHESGLFATAVGLSVLEVVAGTCLLLDIRGGLAVIAAMLVLFIGVLGYGIWLGLDIECGCLGPEDWLDIRSAVWMDVSLLALCAYVYWWRWARSTKPRSLV